MWVRVSPVSYTHLDVYKRQIIPIPTLPINNIIIVGATGRQNKSVKKQMSLELTSNDVTIPIGFLVAHGLPFNILIGCDILIQHAAIIDLRRGVVTLTSEDGTWTADVIDTHKDNASNANCQVIGSHYCTTNRTLTIPQYEDDNPELWQDKLEEIREFQRTRTSNQVSEAQAEQLIRIYNKYQHNFSNAPGKVKDYQCTISFKTPVDFHRK